MIQPTRTQRTHVDEKSTPYIRPVEEIMLCAREKKRDREIKFCKKKFWNNFYFPPSPFTISLLFSQKPSDTPLPTALCVPDLSRTNVSGGRMD